MRDFKKHVSKQVVQKLAEDGKKDLLESFVVPVEKSKKRSHQVWMDEFWDENVYSEWFFRQKLDYIHSNPVKCGLVKSSDEYRYSSFRNYFLDDESVIRIDRVEW
jgi:REP element-mobilizing transposase RayT